MDVRSKDGTKLHVTVQGKGPPVLWLQGLNAPGAAWAVQIAQFSSSRTNVAPDARGVGQSDAPPGPYTTAQLAEDAVAVLDALAIGSVDVVGLSLGGAAAQELALRHPERVRSLALLSTFAVQPPRTVALLDAWRELYPIAPRGAWEKQAYAWLFTDRFWRSEANVRAALRFASTQPRQSEQGFLGQLAAAVTHDTRSRLGAIRAPTLVMHGALDQLAPLATGEELARLIPGAELIVLPDVGHAVNLEGQRELNRALRLLWARSLGS